MARRGRPPTWPARAGEQAQPLSEEEENALALEAAQAYYLGGESKVAIAERLGITRFQTARLLTVARESGMVHIEVRAPGGIDRELSVRLQNALGVKRAIVVSSLAGVSPLDDVGFALAHALSDVVVRDNFIGLTWSRTTISMTQQLTHLEQCSVVQLGGHLAAIGMPGAVEIVRETARVSGGTAYPIYAPLIVEDAHTARSLRAQPAIAAAMALFDKLDIAVMSIGAWRPSASTVYDSLPETLRRKATELGVVGEIGGRLFDGRGESVAGLIDDRVIGITLDQLRTVRESIITGYGAYRSDALLAAAKTGLFTTVLTDRSLAEAMLDNA